LFICEYFGDFNRSVAPEKLKQFNKQVKKPSGAVYPLGVFPWNIETLSGIGHPGKQLAESSA
jgi:hypothetical protein